MSTSILSKNIVTNVFMDLIEPNVVNDSSENMSNLFAGLDELLKQLSDEIAKHEPIYDVPRTTSLYEPIGAFSTYDHPKSIESHYDTPKSLANRPLPPLPVEPLMADESIYEEISPVKPAKDKDTAKSKVLLHQAKVYLLKSLRSCLHSLNKIFNTIRFTQSNDSMKTQQGDINNDPVLEQKIMLDLAEFKFPTLGSSESLENLIQHLKNVIFVLEGRIEASMKVSHSPEYGDMLIDTLKQPMEIAKLDLEQAKARLAEVKGLETELALTNTASTQAPVSVANNRFSLFSTTASTAAKMEENILYDSTYIIKGMTRSAG